jgi:hypothetical protein
VQRGRGAREVELFGESDEKSKAIGIYKHSL